MIKIDKISIIIPVYNSEKYIEKCLNSIIHQTYKNLEIIVVNDGSSDNSLNIIKNYSKIDKRIKILNQKNEGVSSARNNALKIKTGEYVMFVDSDDWIELNTCEALINEIKKTKSDIVIYNLCKEYKDYKINNPKFNICCDNEDELNQYIRAKIIAPQLKIKGFDIIGLEYACNKLIKSKLIENIFFEMEKQKAIWEDVLFFSKIFEKKCKVLFVNEYFYHYKINSCSASNNINLDILKINEIFYNSLIKLENRNKLINDAIHIRMIHNLRKELTLYIFNKGNKLSIRNRIKLLKKELKKEHFSNSIKAINIRNVKTKLKIYVILFKLHMYFFIYILNKVEQLKKSKKMEE